MPSRQQRAVRQADVEVGGQYECIGCEDGGESCGEDGDEAEDAGYEVPAPEREVERVVCVVARLGDEDCAVFCAFEGCVMCGEGGGLG